MRKYYQAALAITAIVSLISLLFYRHEYNKLRYVLEVFNYFGKPNQKGVETNCTNTVPGFTKYNMRFEEPVSSWQRLDDNLYVYSAYSIREKEVQVIGFGMLDSVKGLQCVIFFENEIKPEFGSFKYVPIVNELDSVNVKKGLNYSGYHFYCSYASNKVPVGISFLTKSNINYNDTPILSVKTQLQILNYTNTGACVTPPLIKPMDLLNMISFINFQDIIGIDNFLIYDFGIPNDFNSYLKELFRAQNPYWKFTYTVIPWNFPFPGIDHNIIRNIIEADCLYRTYNKIMYVTTLSWEEYVVLRHHHSLIDLMATYKRYKLWADRYKLTTLTFCTQQVDSKHSSNSTFMIFRKTRYDSSIIDNHPIYIHNSHQILKKSKIHTNDIGKDLITLNRYKYCYEKESPEAGVYDTAILNFTGDVKNSPILKEFMLENRFLLNKQ